MKTFRQNNVIKFIAIICIVSVLFTSCHTKFNMRENVEYIKPSYSGDNYHKSTLSQYETITKSGLVELLFDKTTATVAVRDINSGEICSTLPDSNIPKKVQSYALEITLSNGGNKVYTLNSQDNSVAHGNYSYKTSSNSVSVTYSMALDKETGAKDTTQIKNGEIRADLTMNYTLNDGSLYVNVDMNNIFLSNGIYLEDMTILNNFGAYETGSLEDYLFVPDGCGAIIKTGIDDGEFTPVSLSVYGEDAGTSDIRKTSECLIGAFGIRHFENGFICIIEKGDSIARINAYRNNEESLNSVHSSFKITDVCNKNRIGIPYKGEIQLCYRFLSGKTATYPGMATACRETLIRNSVLPANSVTTKSEYMPMVVSLYGGYIDEKGKYSVLSDYNQALSLMTLLKAKDVNNVHLRYNEVHDNNKNFNDFEKALGSNNNFNELYTYINSQHFSLFIDTDILTYSNRNSGAQNICGNDITIETTLPFQKNNELHNYLKLGKLEDRINNILIDSEKFDFDGYALNDAGNILYSDYSENSYSKANSKEEITKHISVLSNSKMLMVDSGNIYTVKNADIITNIPISTLAYPEKESYTGIPFVQMLLHGIIDYSTTGLNTHDDVAVSFLKALEYGCVPSVEWYCTPYNETMDEKFFCDKNIAEMVSYYSRTNNALSMLRDARMTSHYCVQEGVYCTEYDNSIKVYVNYTDDEVTINGIIIESMDCITIS